MSFDDLLFLYKLIFLGETYVWRFLSSGVTWTPSPRLPSSGPGQTLWWPTISWATHSRMIVSTKLTPLTNHFIGYTFKNDSKYRANATNQPFHGLWTRVLLKRTDAQPWRAMYTIHSRMIVSTELTPLTNHFMGSERAFFWKERMPNPGGLCIQYIQEW